MTVADNLRGVTHAGGGSSVLTSCLLHEDTQPGDLLVLVGTVGTQGGPGSFTVTDSRFTKVRDADAPPAPDGTLWSDGSVWVGYALDTDDEAALDPVSLYGSPGGSSTDVAKVAVASFRMRANLERVATVESDANTYTLPALPSSGDGAVVAVVGRLGLGEASWDGGSGWTTLFTGDAYCEVAIGIKEGATIAASSVTWAGVAPKSHSVVIGLGPVPTEAPMCRKFPVEPPGRQFPPGKSRQRSNRRFGHY